MVMVVSFCVLGVYNMANGLKRIAKILPEVWKDLEELNKRFDEREKANGQSNVLPTSDAGIRTVGRDNNESCSGCEKQSNTTTGE
jgi:hypothetical protein